MSVDGAVVPGWSGWSGDRPCDCWNVGEYCLAECVGDTCDEAFWDADRPCDLAVGEEDEAVGRGGLCGEGDDIAVSYCRVQDVGVKDNWFVVVFRGGRLDFVVYCCDC